MKRCAYWFVIIGGLNWLLVGVAGFDLVQFLFGWLPILASIIYIIVGLSAVYLLFKGDCKKCDSKKESEPQMTEMPPSQTPENPEM